MKMSNIKKESAESTESTEENRVIKKLEKAANDSKLTKVYSLDILGSYKELIIYIKTLLKECVEELRSFIILDPNWDYLERRTKWNLNFAKTTIDAIVKVIDEIEKLCKHEGNKQENANCLNAPLTCELKARFNDIKHSLGCVKQILETSKDGKYDITVSDSLFERCLDLLNFFQKIEKLLKGLTNIDDVRLLREIMGPIHAAQRYVDKKRPIIVPGETKLTLISDKNSQFFSFTGYSWGFTYTEPHYNIKSIIKLRARENKESLRYGGCIGIASAHKIDGSERFLIYYLNYWFSPWRSVDIKEYDSNSSAIFQIVHPDGISIKRNIRIGDKVCLILEENKKHICGSTIIKRLEFSNRNEPRRDLIWTIHDNTGKLSTE